MHNLLERGEKDGQPLSFTIFIPHWENAECHILLMQSKFLQFEFLTAKNEHVYVVGFQHKHDQKQKQTFNYQSGFDSHVYCLQNELGKKKWPTHEKIELLKNSFKVSTR